MNLGSVAFRVTMFHADEARCEVTLQEIRRPVAFQGPQNQLSGAATFRDNSCAPPTSILTTQVTPDQLAGIRIGDIFELTASLVKEASPFPGGLSALQASPTYNR
jgi:hypothetical protein